MTADDEADDVESREVTLAASLSKGAAALMVQLVTFISSLFDPVCGFQFFVFQTSLETTGPDRLFTGEVIKASHGVGWPTSQTCYRCIPPHWSQA